LTKIGGGEGQSEGESGPAQPRLGEYVDAVHGLVDAAGQQGTWSARAPSPSIMQRICEAVGVRGASGI